MKLDQRIIIENNEPLCSEVQLTDAMFNRNQLNCIKTSR